MKFSYYQYSDQDPILVQPQSIKYRMAYRSPHSSLRWNQAASQFLYDVSKLYQAVNTLETKYTNYLGYLNESATPSFSAEVYDDTLATPALVPVRISSFETLAATLDALDKRLRVLEMRRNA